MRRALPSVLLCAALLTAGCATVEAKPGATAPAPTPTAVATTPVDQTRAVRDAVAATGRTSARFSYRTEIGTSPSAAPYVITTRGAHDFARDLGSLRSGMGTVAQFEEVLTAKRIYLRGTVGEETMPWSSLDRADVEARHALRAPANDPEYTLRQVALGERFTRVGEEKLNGAPVTHYRGHLPHAALTLEMAEDRRALVDKIRKLLGGPLPASADVWVDGRKRVVKMRLSMNIEGMPISVNTLTLTELGKPVKVTVPSADEAAESDGSILG
ncbi:hypothetical protein [Streptomyces sp. NBC_00572]|uniref:hypothetical protein n=1 Tax=Streptomyces sp. NBC_00572 TaxID=2903664 RepID=UPI00225AD05E|nr:hypothetical protein [Streptomyces sp. NBC_00572]MCX4982662.1 hypothetical protein [Streptomyces sp. NBC_00572]